MWKYSEYRSSLEDFGLWSKSGPLHVLGSKIKLEHAAAAAKSLQSCPTLCDPMDGSPPGSPILGILQARTLEWVASSFSDAWKWEVKVKLLSRVWLFATPWTAAYQAPPSMGFSRQEYWGGLPLPSLDSVSSCPSFWKHIDISYVSPLWDKWLTNLLARYVSCFFILLTVLWRAEIFLVY